MTVPKQHREIGKATSTDIRKQLVINLLEPPKTQKEQLLHELGKQYVLLNLLGTYPELKKWLDTKRTFKSKYHKNEPRPVRGEETRRLIENLLCFIWKPDVTKVDGRSDWISQSTIRRYFSKEIIHDINEIKVINTLYPELLNNAHYNRDRDEYSILHQWKTIERILKDLCDEGIGILETKKNSQSRVQYRMRIERRIREGSNRGRPFKESGWYLEGKQGLPIGAVRYYRPRHEKEDYPKSRIDSN